MFYSWPRNGKRGSRLKQATDFPFSPTDCDCPQAPAGSMVTVTSDVQHYAGPCLDLASATLAKCTQFSTDGDVVPTNCPDAEVICYLTVSVPGFSGVRYILYADCGDSGPLPSFSTTIATYGDSRCASEHFVLVYLPTTISIALHLQHPSQAVQSHCAPNKGGI